MNMWLAVACITLLAAIGFVVWSCRPLCLRSSHTSLHGQRQLAAWRPIRLKRSRCI